MGTWIVNGMVVEADNTRAIKHLLIENGKIATITNSDLGTLDTTGHEVIDATNKLVSPGLIDMHVHLREPGFEYKETIETGTKSAASGGYTAIACMPNTRPIIGTPETVKLIQDKAETEGSGVRVLIYGSITINELGRELTDFEAMKKSGVIGFTDDGVGVQNAQVMKNAMSLAKSLDMPIIAHCEDDSLVVGAPVAEGSFAEKHGLKGIPNESEAIHVGRDVLLAEATGVHYHVCHVSTEQSVRLIRQGKAVGINVTGEVCPHHLLLSEEDIPSLDANWKMNPPLRSAKDVEAMIAAVEDGTIDIIVTDHAPHSEEDKAKGMQAAPFGIVGLETAFPLMYTKFVATGRWTLAFLLDKMTVKPAEVFGLPWGSIAEGREADLTIIDLETEQEVNPDTFLSKGRNTPFVGWKLKGWPVMTIVSGKVVWSK